MMLVTKRNALSMKLTLVIFSLDVFHFCENVKNPVVLIPGLGCSRIDVKMDENADIISRCKTKSKDYFTVWVNILYGITHTPKCIYDTLSLTYDGKTHKTNNRRGIYTQIPGFGFTNAIESLTTIEFVFPYFKKLVKRLVKEGYARESSIRAAPYDFRKGPTEQSEYFQDLKLLIEETYEDNGQKRIVLIVHSLGGPMSLLFLRQQTRKWREQFIRCMISLSGAWAGSVKALDSYYGGFGFNGLEFLPKSSSSFPTNLPSKPPFPYFIWPSLSLIPKKLIRTWPGFIWMFPTPEAWEKTDTLVRINDKSYTLESMEEFFKYYLSNDNRDIGEPNGWEMYRDIYPYVKDLSKPEVELHCLYGLGIRTVASVYSKDSFWDSFRFPINGDGDGMVNIRSLEVCKKWIGGTYKVTTTAFSGINHSTILSNSKVLDHIVQLLRGA